MLKISTLLRLSLLALVLLSEAVMSKPIVIAHRGGSGYLPEHTLEAATLAYTLGADYIEQDLVLSKDNHLIVLHDIHLETTTDVEVKFPERARQDGRFYALDFTLAELKTLSVHERKDKAGQPVFPNRYQGNADFKLATFDEQIELIKNLNRQFNKQTGIYPEIKSPAWHKQQGHDISKLVIKALEQHQLNTPDANLYIQCFDFKETQRLRNELGLKTKLIQLIAENDWGESDSDYDYLRTTKGLADIASVADGIGPWIPQVVDLKSAKATSLVRNAHAAKLKVHPYTFRLEQLPDLEPDAALDILFNEVGIDGLFTDFSDTVVEFLNKP